MTKSKNKKAKKRRIKKIKKLRKETCKTKWVEQDRSN